jgi:CubicO group peptidase (beta-lactamase class C family)
MNFQNIKLKTELSKHMEDLLDDNTVLSYSLIQDHKILVADTIAKKLETSEQPIFQACSLSKTLTAMAVLSLVAEGRIHLDQPVNKQLKSWQIEEDANQITSRHCLTMTSGLCYGMRNANLSGYPQQAAIPTLQNILKGESPATNLNIKPYIQPGIDYYYTGAGFMVLQQLIVDSVARPFADFMNEFMVKTLNMQHSTFACPIEDKFRQEAVPGFDKQGKKLNDGWENIPTAASGGLWSTPQDLAQMLLYITQSYLGKESNLLPQSLAKDMLSIQKNSRLGLGVALDGTMASFNFRKNGFNTGYHNEFMMFPHTGQGIVIMTNTANGMPLIKKAMDYLATQYAWPKFSMDFDEINPSV